MQTCSLTALANSFIIGVGTLLAVAILWGLGTCLAYLIHDAELPMRRTGTGLSVPETSASEKGGASSANKE